MFDAFVPMLFSAKKPCGMLSNGLDIRILVAFDCSNFSKIRSRLYAKGMISWGIHRKKLLLNGIITQLGMTG